MLILTLGHQAGKLPKKDPGPLFKGNVSKGLAALRRICLPAAEEVREPTSLSEPVL
jgi:hypothetical protein